MYIEPKYLEQAKQALGAGISWRKIFFLQTFSGKRPPSLLRPQTTPSYILESSTYHLNKFERKSSKYRIYMNLNNKNSKFHIFTPNTPLGTFSKLLESSANNTSHAWIMAATMKESWAWVHALPMSSLGLRMVNSVVHLATGLWLDVKFVPIVTETWCFWGQSLFVYDRTEVVHQGDGREIYGIA